MPIYKYQKVSDQHTTYTLQTNPDQVNQELCTIDGVTYHYAEGLLPDQFEQLAIEEALVGFQYLGDGGGGDPDLGAHRRGELGPRQRRRHRQPQLPPHLPQLPLERRRRRPGGGGRPRGWRPAQPPRDGLPP